MVMISWAFLKILIVLQIKKIVFIYIILISVDVFIPLYKSSTADDVSRWLAKLGFSQS